MKCAKTQNMPSREGERIVDLLTIYNVLRARLGPKWWPGIFVDSDFFEKICLFPRKILY